MDKILETIMNFINENTTLLIIICVFLIFVLIGYLIDNSIKTRKLEKQMKYDIDPPKVDNEEISNKIEETIPEEPKEEIVEEKVTIDPETEIDLDFRTPEEKEKDNKKEEIEEPAEEVTEKIEETQGNEITVDSKINELLLRDFSTNGITEVEEEQEDVSLNPIDSSNTFDMPEIKEEKSVYKNSKKLSDILNKKKKTEEPKVELNSTMDFSNELDRILQKLNETNDISTDSSLDETQDYTNMF